MLKRILLSLTIVIIAIGTLVPPAQSASDGWAIETVRSGDSLDKIAKRYGTRWRRIQQLNGLTGERIVPGQALIVPKRRLLIQSGDSMWEIALRHGLTLQQLQQANKKTTGENLPIGSRLSIPSPKRYAIETGLFFVPTGNLKKDRSLLHHYGKFIHRIGLFSVEIAPNGSLNTRSFGQATNQIRQQGKAPYPVITNLTERGFDKELIHQILHNPTKRRILVESIWHLLKANRFPGVMLDIEQLQPQDRSMFRLFLKELSGKLHPSGMEITISVPPKQSATQPSHSTGYDYKAIGQYTDRVFVMAYDWYIPPFTEAGPIAPYPMVKETMTYASSVIPPKKLYLGIPMYAYEWEKGSKYGRAMSQQKALQQAIHHGATISFDPHSRSPSYRYGKGGRERVVWFEDARSLASKFSLVRTYGWAGVGGWQMNLQFPQGETLLWLTFRPK